MGRRPAIIFFAFYGLRRDRDGGEEAKNPGRDL
jgi:hypothetical protein